MSWLVDRLAWLVAPWTRLSDLERDVMRLKLQVLALQDRLDD